MKFRRIIGLLVVFLFLSLVVEKAIPHTHTEHHGVILPDFHHEGGEEGHSDGEELHSSVYQLSHFTFAFQSMCVSSILVKVSKLEQLPLAIHLANYNLIPKILESILFEIHIYSSKAPPVLN